MKHQQEQSKEIQKQDSFSRFRQMAIVYLDIVIRSLISFVVIGLGLSIILMGFLKWSWIIVLPIVFILSIIVAPSLSKIKLGEKVFLLYESWLQKTFKIKS